MKKKLTSRQYFAKLQTIHAGIIAGVVIFGALSFLIPNATALQDDELLTILEYVTLAVVLAGVGSGLMQYRRRIPVIANHENMQHKMASLYSAQISRWTMMALPPVVCAVNYWVMHSIIFLAAFGFLVSILAILFPSKKKTIRDLQLIPKDIEVIQKSDAVVAVWEAEQV